MNQFGLDPWQMVAGLLAVLGGLIAFYVKKVLWQIDRNDAKLEKLKDDIYGIILDGKIARLLKPLDDKVSSIGSKLDNLHFSIGISAHVRNFPETRMPPDPS